MAPEIPDSSEPSSGEPHEYKLGPMVFVPGFAVRERDPWAHRKGEPRIFALFWSIYLMIASLVTLFAAGPRRAPSSLQFEYGSRSLILLLIIGATLLWPAVRLSQQSPNRIGRAVWVDLAIILIPIQAIIWPMPLLTRWPFEVLAGVALLIASWTALSGALIYCGLVISTNAGRVGSMAGCLAAALTAPAAMAVASWSTQGALPTGWRLASPLTAIWAITTAPPGLTPRMSTVDWLCVSAPLIPAIVFAFWGHRTHTRSDRGGFEA